MKPQSILAKALAILSLSAASTLAATMSASSSAPVINDADIANYGVVSNTDKWFTGADGAARGQSITTGAAAVRLKAISYQVSDGNGATATKTYTLRVGKVAGNNFTQVHTENATQNFNWTGGQFMTWTFATPVLLEPYTTYGIDVGMVTSTSGYQTGIPYINLTADDYAGGTSYSSGTAGIGTASISSAINTDRIFHLDIERPLNPAFSLVVPYPADNATDAFASREIVMTFSQNVTPGSGNVTIRNLTDNTSTTLAANDSRLIYADNVVRINPAGLITWSKNYAIRIDAGTFLGTANAPIAAITDDTTWNFTTIASDPLLAAIAALKTHVITPTTLTGPQISAHKTTIDNNRQRFAETTEIINAVFNLISTYDTTRGPLFVSGSTTTSFDRNNTTSISPENYHWVIYTVMQYTMDLIYTVENVAKYESTLLNYKFGSHTSFPGPCSPPANPANTHNVQINGSFPATFGRLTQMWTTPARKPTGTYLAPGTIATVTVPPALVNAGYKIRVCAHSWDLSARRPVNRLERASRLFSITSATTKIASPYGGGIYIEVPYLANAGTQSVTVTGGVRAPYFSAKSIHQTTATEWTTERTNPAPWADFQSEKFMVQVPRKWIFNMTGAQAVQLMVDWDKAMDTINDLMGFPRDRGKETMYCQTDVILRSAVHAPGYPAINVTSNVNSDVSPLGYAGNYLVRGPGASATAAHIEFHEQGHAYGFPKFGGENESNVNLLQPAMLNRAFGYSFDVAQAGSLGSGSAARNMDNSAIAWMCVFNFSPREVPMADGEKAYQHKGHAKYMDIARLFGWDKLDTFWRTYMQDGAGSESTDDLLLRLSKAVGADVRPLFHFWGIHPQNPATLSAAIAAANPPIPSSNVIRLELLRYKGLVPANNAAFRTFATAWWGKQPSIGGAWEEREHSRQWDTAALYGVGDQQRSEATNPGEIFNENSANDIRNRVDELIALYYPGAITPNPMTFATAPTVVNPTTVGMTATTATGGTGPGPIEYLFEETTGNAGGDDSLWQTNPIYQDSGLTPGLTYSYKVSARDGSLNTTDPSAILSVTPTSGGDITPPAPSTMTFATPPNTVDATTITMTASTASDINDVEYYFENITNSTNSGWQNSPVYTAINLQLATPYSFRVKARDKSANFNETAFSATASANTGNLPDETPPQLVSLIPADAAVVSNLASNLVVTFDEPILEGTGSVTLKNLTDATEVVFNIEDPAITVAGSTLTLNPPTDLLYEKTYAVQISTAAVADVANNPFIGIDDDETWSFSTVLALPIVNSGGPYLVPTGSSLTLNGSAIPSTGATIAPAGYEWDLNRDNVFGDVTGATPAAIADTVLTASYGMVSGQNTIKLKVTDSLGNTSTVTTIVKIGINLSWDALNNSGQNDGGGEWFGANRWRDGSLNTNWISGCTANFGINGNGGAIILGASTTVNALAYNAFNGTYTISGGGVLTVNNGLTNNSSAGSLSFVVPVILGAPQTWGGTSTGSLTASGGIKTNGHTLTIGVNGTVDMDAGANVISGSGGITKNGTGRMFLGSGAPVPTHTYSGTTTINGGSIMFSANLGTGNLTITNGYYESYYGGSITRSLGSGAGEVQILSGASGFSNNGNTGFTVKLNNSAFYEVVWGSTFFNPSTLLLQAPTDQKGSTVNFDNKLDLNGANRTISVASTTDGTGSSTLAQVVRNSSVTTPAGLIKTGSGRLNLNNANTYNGGTTLQAGTLQLGNATGLGAASGSLTVNGGLLNLNDQTVSVGNLSGAGGTIANNASNARVLTIGSGNGDGGVYQGVIANRTSGTTGTVALTKTGTGTITLANSNTYTGATLINGGGKLILTGATQATTAITFAANSSLGLAIGSQVNAASAAVNFTNGTVSVTGTPSAPSHVLLTAQSFTGTPVLATAIPGYQLAVVGTQLQLNQIVTDPFALWAVGGVAFDVDTNGDGVDNGLAWLLGAASPNENAADKLPKASRSGDNLRLTFRCLKTAGRGGVALKVQSSIDFGASDPWSTHEASVPDADGTVGGVVFGTTADADPAFINVIADIPVAGARLFARLKAEPAP